MAYRLKANESVPKAVTRTVLEEVKSATDGLTARNGNRDEAIHEARKSVKKVRGVLRLMRPELGKTYDLENQRFRDIGHELSEIRDAAALLEIFDRVAEKYQHSLQKDALSGIRKGLEDAKAETEQAVNIDRAATDAIRAFRQAGKNVKTWQLKDDGFAAIAPGLELTYRAGRTALKRVKNRPTPENYHYLRRRAKDHWYHVRLLESLWTEVQKAHENSLDELQNWLGDEHNLVVLHQKFAQDPEKYGDKEQVQLFCSLSEQEQKQLRANAVSLAERIFEQKPKQFMASMKKLWTAWQRQPASMKRVQKQQRDVRKKSGAPAAHSAAHHATA